LRIGQFLDIAGVAALSGRLRGLVFNWFLFAAKL
jgi:hypothetical protein